MTRQANAALVGKDKGKIGKQHSQKPDNTRARDGHGRDRDSMRHSWRKSPRPLVRLGYSHCWPSTCRLCNRWSTGGLSPFVGGGAPLWGCFLLLFFPQLSPPGGASQEGPLPHNLPNNPPSSPVPPYYG